jgi:hypothetical protein
MNQQVNNQVIEVLSAKNKSATSKAGKAFSINICQCSVLDKESGEIMVGELALFDTPENLPSRGSYLLRHTWASWHIQEGTPLHVLQELGGWSTPEMVQKYAHLSSEHLAQWVDRRFVVLPKIVPESDTFFTTGQEKGLSISA